MNERELQRRLAKHLRPKCIPDAVNLALDCAGDHAHCPQVTDKASKDRAASITKAIVASSTNNNATSLATRTTNFHSGQCWIWRSYFALDQASAVAFLEGPAYVIALQLRCKTSPNNGESYQTSTNAFWRPSEQTRTLSNATESIAKPLWGQLHRGFESVPLRQFFLGLDIRGARASGTLRQSICWSRSAGSRGSDFILALQV
jgi:hypothetical protein